jgi:hypothetical protein
MYTTETFFALVNIDTNPLGTLMLSSANENVTVRIEALTYTPTHVAQPQFLADVAIGPLNSSFYDIPAGTFPQGVGAIRARSIVLDAGGNPLQSSAPFMAYFTTDGLPAMFPVSGTSTQGIGFRMPYLKPALGVNQTVKLGITNLGAPQRVNLRNPQATGFRKFVDLETLQSVEWDSGVEGVNMNKNGILEIEATGNNIVVSATFVLSTGTLTRVYPSTFP